MVQCIHNIHGGARRNRREEPTARTAILGEDATFAGDLGEYLDAGTLREIVANEVERSCQRPPASLIPDQPGARELLGVLTYAYARRLFESDEIARRCHTEPNLRRLSRDTTPFANELIRYRRHHREQLESVLASVLLRTAEHVNPAKFSGAWPELSRKLLRQAAVRLNTARHMDSYNE